MPGEARLGRLSGVPSAELGYGMLPAEVALRALGLRPMCGRRDAKAGIAGKMPAVQGA